ncbi:MAG TPA: hypothetical protein VMV95_01395 [Bacillota bacterium]|nr:hypothetical protein [Bacillota bacterium]
MEKTKFPEFKGKSLDFLEGDFGKAFLEEYKGRVKSNYDKNSNLNVLGYDDVVKGSNPFAVVLANQILREENLRTATQADLEKALKIGRDFQRTYQDTGLVLRNKKDRDYSKNNPLAKDLAKQLKKRGIRFSLKTPVMIPLIGFELEKADNDYGLTFKLREDAEIYEAPILSKPGKFNSKDIDEKTGLPKKISDFGDRPLYAWWFGLSRLDLSSSWFWVSGVKSLGVSYDVGRIVVVSEKLSNKTNCPEDYKKK